MTWQPQPAHPLFPECRVRCGWLFSSKCRAGCPYCSSRASVQAGLAAGARWWTDDSAVQAWQAAFDKYGPVMIDMTGLEATEELDLCGRVARIGHAQMYSTNMMFDPLEFAAAVPADRAVLCTSFHPHLWGYAPEPFLWQVAAVRATGHRVISASVVAHPPLLSRIGDWLKAFRAADLATTVHPFQGMYEGRLYPGSYTPEEKAIVDALLGDEREKAALALQQERPRIAACAAGMLYFGVALDGTVKRCVGYPETMGQNFYRDELCLLPEPQPCIMSRCPCEALYQFHIPEGEL